MEGKSDLQLNIHQFLLIAARAGAIAVAYSDLFSLVSVDFSAVTDLHDFDY